jgi:hypothetical protein
LDVRRFVSLRSGFSLLLMPLGSGFSGGVNSARIVGRHVGCRSGSRGRLQIGCKKKPPRA